MLIVVVAIVSMIGTYQFTPVAYNTEINNKNAAIELEMYDLDGISGKKKDVDYEKIMRDNPNADLSYVKKYFKWGQAASAYLTEQFYNGKIHPSNTRAKQLVYSMKKYNRYTYR